MGKLVVIPPITDPMGKGWRQPDSSKILIDNEIALMASETFNALPEYSTTKPSGVYPGKCWKARLGRAWYLRWYDNDDGDPRGLPTPCRLIVIDQ